MALHIIKLCVGAESIRDLEEWIEDNTALHRRLGRVYEPTHTTRMLPKRADELLDGGSLYWVIKGQLCARQRFIDIRAFTDGQGTSRCHLVLDHAVVPVSPRPYRPFQGWRYLAAKDAPADLGLGAGADEMPEDLRRELAGLGLL
jgi:hypothetical protein